MRRFTLMLICAVAALLPFSAMAQNTAPMPSLSMPGVVVPNGAVQSVAPTSMNTFVTYQQCMAMGGQAFPIGDPVFQNDVFKFYQMKCVVPQRVGCIENGISDKLDRYPVGDTVDVCTEADRCCGIGGDGGVLPPNTCYGCQPTCCCSTRPQCGGRFRFLPIRQRSRGCCLKPRCCQQPAPCFTETYCPIAPYAVDANYTYWRAAKCQQFGLCVPTWSNKILRYPIGTIVIPGCDPFNYCRCFTSGGTLMQ